MANPYNGFTPAERDKAWVVQKDLQAAGKLSWKDKPCEICGQLSPGIMPHLENYYDVTDIHPLCVECHMKLHARFRNKGSWNKLLFDVSEGRLPKIWISYGQYFKANNFFNAVAYNTFNVSLLGDEWYHKLTLSLQQSEHLKAYYAKLTGIKPPPEQLSLL